MIIDESLDDLVLVKAAQAGELDAENALLMRYKHRAQLICSKYFIPGGDKDDLEQEAMIGLFEAIHAYKDDYHASFWAFASMCIHREIITAIKTANRKKKAFLNNYVSLNEQAYDDNTDEFYNLINELIENMSNEGAIIPETLTKYRYPRFKDEDEEAAWLEKKTASLTNSDESTFDLVCDLSRNVKDKSSLRRYLYAISNRKLTYAVKYINTVSNLLLEMLGSEDDSETSSLIEMMNCVHNQMTIGRIAAYDIVILYKVYIRLLYYNYA